MNKFQKNSELQALLSLLDETDTEIFLNVQNKILSYGIEAVPTLENSWDTADTFVQKRIESIIHQLQYENVAAELINWKRLGARNLLFGALLVAKYQFPNLNEEHIRLQIELIKKDVWLELNNNLTPLEKVKVINHILYKEHGFTGDSSNVFAPQHLFINQVIETRRGTPISLGIIYLLIAQHLDMPVFGVDLHQMFILAYTNENEQDKLSFLNKNDVLFYINAFNKGAVFTQKEIDFYLKQLKISPQESYYKPCSNLVIINRLIKELILGYQKLGQSTKIQELEKLAEIVNKTDY